MLLGFLVIADTHYRITTRRGGVHVPGTPPSTPEAAVDRIVGAASRGGRWYSAHPAIPDDPRRSSGILTAFHKALRGDRSLRPV